MLRHPWLKSTDDPLQGDAEDDHDFNVVMSYRRQECNFLGLFSGGAKNPSDPQESTQMDSHRSHSTQSANIDVLNIENIFHEESVENSSGDLSTVRKTKQVVKGQPSKLSYANYCAVT
jgi:hypothetical protein